MLAGSKGTVPQQFEKKGSHVLELMRKNKPHSEDGWIFDFTFNWQSSAVTFQAFQLLIRNPFHE